MHEQRSCEKCQYYFLLLSSTGGIKIRSNPLNPFHRFPILPLLAKRMEALTQTKRLNQRRDK
jgi:hypothetical protein